MAWNQPGGGDKDPWKGGDSQGKDVDDFLNRLKSGMNRMLGGDDNRRGGPNIVIWIVGALLLWVVLDAWVMIDERQSGVVLRLGKFDRLMTPGPNFKLPRPFESVTKVDVTQLRSISDQVRMLTSDENIVQIEYNVQYLVADPKSYLFGARDPDDTLKQAAESAVRDVIGSSAMDQVLTGERAALAADAKQRLQTTLDDYTTGLQVSVFNLQNARPPSEVREAFDDAISAREDRERIESEAEAYASKVVPEARGDAARIRAEAEGYKQSVIARAEGDAQRFTLLADEYAKAPEVTRKRLYLETMQDVLARNRKVYAGDGDNVLYLPLDGATGSRSAASSLPAPARSVGALPSTTSMIERETRRPERPLREEGGR